MNAENTAAGVSCAEVLISPENLALRFFVLCLFSLFSIFLSYFHFPLGQLEKDELGQGFCHVSGVQV